MKSDKSQDLIALGVFVALVAGGWATDRFLVSIEDSHAGWLFASLVMVLVLFAFWLAASWVCRWAVRFLTKASKS
jgi:hypothetical protein